MSIAGAEAAAMGLPTLGDLERRTDPMVNPAAAQAAANAFMGKNEGEKPPPLPPPPPDDTFELPGGYVDPAGVLQRTCRVRDLNGEDEEELARPAVRMTPVALIDAIVHRCVVQLGPHKVGTDIPETELDQMLVGDRDMVALVVRRITYGRHIPMDTTCPACQNEFKVRYDLVDDVPIKQLPGDPGKLVREVPLDHPVLGPGKAKVRLVTGEVQKSVMAKGVSNELTNHEITTLMLRETVDEFRGDPVNRVEDVRKWKALDRKTLREFLDETTCGPRYEEVSQACPRCQHKFPLWIGLGDLFP